MNSEQKDRALLASVESGNLLEVRSLLEAGGDPNRMFSGETNGWAMCLAVEYPNTKMLELLIEYGGDTNLLNNDASQSRATPLACSIFMDSPDPFYFLLENGADPSKPLCTDCEHLIQFTHLVKAAFNRRYTMAFEIYTRVGLTSFDEKALLHAVENFPIIETGVENQARLKLIEVLRSRGVEVNPWTSSNN